MSFKRKRPREPALDITPLVDTVFNLLIFFALSLNFIITPGIQVKLPSSSFQEVRREKENLIVIITKEGKTYFQQKEVSPVKLLSLLSKKVEKNKENLVIIQADRGVIHGKVVEVMDLAKKAGFQKLAIATQLSKEKGER